MATAQMQQSMVLEHEEHANLYAHQAGLATPLPGTPGQSGPPPSPIGGPNQGQKPHPSNGQTTAQQHGTQQMFARRPGMNPGA